MKQDIIPYHQLRQNHSRSTARLYYSRPTAEPVQVIEIVDTYIIEPTPMIRPIESLTAEEKVQVLERALLRAKQAAKAERRRGLRRRILT